MRFLHKQDYCVGVGWTTLFWLKVFFFVTFYVKLICDREKDINRKKDNGEQYLAINAGKNSSNYQVKDIANAVAKLIPKTKISINKDAPPDKRSYSVNFNLYEKLAPEFQPIITLEKSICRLRDGFLKMNFSNKNFRESSFFMRLYTLREHIRNNRLGKDLRWKSFWIIN